MRLDVTFSFLPLTNGLNPKIWFGLNVDLLDEGLVPIKKAIATTGHRSMDAFEKYNHEKKALFEKATRCVLFGEF
jgi:hypothetical protein